jgi:hypothetical protein
MMAKTMSSQEADPRNDAPAAMTSAQRAALFRRRRRAGLVLVRFELRDTELDVMVRHGLLTAEQRNDAAAIFLALGALLDRAVAALEAGRLPEVPR